MRSYTKRRRRRPEPPVLTEEQREDLKALLAAIPDGASESHPAFLRLLDYWVRIPYKSRPVTVPAYHTRDGAWVTAGAPQVMDTIRRTVAD